MADPRHQLGHAAEAAVATWLSTSGWRILARRWRARGRGELDLVCLDPEMTLVGVEVRARRSERHGSAAESIDRRRILRLRATLAAYVAGAPPHRGMRLDLVTAEPALDGWRLRRYPAVGGW